MRRFAHYCVACLVSLAGSASGIAGMLLALSLTTAAQAQTAGSNWEDAYFRVPFQHNAAWLETDLFLRMTLRRIDTTFETFRLNAGSAGKAEQTLVTMIDAVERNDIAAAKSVIYGYQTPLSDQEYQTGVARFRQVWSAISTPTVLYAIPMVDGVMFVISGTDAQSGSITFNTYRLTERGDGAYGYAVGRAYEEHAALVSRIFLGARERPDIYSEISFDEVMAADVNYSMNIVPEDQQQQMGISSPFELLFRATVIDVPFIGTIDPGFNLPAAVAFFREAFEAVAADPMQDGLSRFFDAQTVKQTREGAEILAAEGGPTMRSLLAKRQIRIVMDADPVWVILHTESNAGPDVRVDGQIYRTDYVIRQGNGDFQIAQVFALPILKSMLATPFVQQKALQRISAGEVETVGSAVRRVEAPASSGSGSATGASRIFMYGLLGLALIGALVMLTRAR